MAQPERPAGHGEELREVGGAVVGHDGANPDVEATVKSHGALQIAGGGDALFIGEHLDVGQAGPVIDADMHELPAGATDPGRAISVDAVSGSEDAAELLDVDMKEIARPAPLVPSRRHLRLEELQSVQAGTLQHPCDGGAGHLEAAGDLRAGLTTTPQAHHQLDPRLFQPPRTATRPRRAVSQSLPAGFSMSGNPLVDRTWADSEGLRGRDHAPLLDQDSMDQQGSTTWCRSGETVDVHPGLLFGLLSASSPTASSNWPRVNNPPYW